MKRKKRILVAEDDPTLATALRDNLELEGFEAQVVGSGDAALAEVAASAPDLVILDVMLPGTDGFEVCRLLRQRERVPIIMLTALGQKEDKLRGLKLGADDYVTKPFDLEELLARIDAVLRRLRPEVDRLVLGDVTVDFAAKQASQAGKPLELTVREFELLHYLAERTDRIVYRDELLRAVWGYRHPPLTRAVDFAIARLRKKIEPDSGSHRYIQTARGDGYILVVDPAAPQHEPEPRLPTR